MKNINILIAGVGGQGVITSGTIISESAISKGLNVIMSEIHGLSQRLGSVTVEVRIGNVFGPISFKNEFDLIIGFEPLETLRSLETVNNSPVVIMNNEKINPISLSMNSLEYPNIEMMKKKYFSNVSFYDLPATEIAMQSGSYRATNVVVVGAAIALNVLPFNIEDVEKVLEQKFSGKELEINKDALKKGMRYISNSNKNTPYTQF
jgi:indolepyruvate ferredoxin oxidoreductase beta subunit